MNAIVAIGSPALMRVAKAYRGQVPSAVWTIGLRVPRDPKDPLVRSLESLIEPFMYQYFGDEAHRRIAATGKQLLVAPVRIADLDTGTFNEAAAATMGTNLVSALSLVVMLDRAHAVQAIELVLHDGRGVLAHTAVAWARARGLPVIAVDERTRSRNGPQVDGGVRESTAIPTAVPVDRSAERRTRRRAARDAFVRGLGWNGNDVVIAFEPAWAWRDSALEPVDAARTSMVQMFDAYVAARAEVPSLRLALIAQPSADGVAVAKAVAADCGLTEQDFAYSIADQDVWIAGADIVVSIDSRCSIDAAVAGVPAVNLWRPESWHRGPVFAADEGVIEIGPRMLASTIVALGRDARLRMQIAEIADRGLVASRALDARSPAEIARDVAQLRRPASTKIGKPKPDIVIVAPDYRHDSAGVRALYRLCHLINISGGNASIYPATTLHPSWNTPRRDVEISDETIVVHPESTEKLVTRGRFVRWVLNVPGLLGGPKTYGPEEMVFYWMKGLREAAQSATAETLTTQRELWLATIDPELYFNDRSRPRLYDCVYIGKGQTLYDRVQPRQIRDALVMRRSPDPWPANRSDTAALLRGCRRLYSFDAHTAIVEEARICGAQVFYVQTDGRLEPELSSEYDYVERYYDLTPVQRFLHLLEERWG